MSLFAKHAKGRNLVMRHCGLWFPSLSRPEARLFRRGVTAEGVGSRRPQRPLGDYLRARGEPPHTRGVINNGGRERLGAGERAERGLDSSDRRRRDPAAAAPRQNEPAK